MLSQAADQPRGDAARALDDFSTALGMDMTSIADALRALHAPQTVPAAAPVYAGLALAPGLPAHPIVDIADLLGDATNTLQDRLRERLAARAGGRARHERR